MPVNVWNHRLDLRDVFHDESRSFEEKRDEIVRRIRAASWFRTSDRSLFLDDIVDELADAQDGGEWDGPWDEFYDYADRERIWVATR